MRETEFQTLVNEKQVGPARFDKAFCVATAAGVATAVGAVAAAGTSIYSASQAGKNAGGGGSKSALYGSKIDMPDYQNNVQIPTFDATTGARDFKAMMPQLLRVSKMATAGGISAREQVMPGGAHLMEQAANIFEQMSRGIVPSDVVDRTNQLVAERMGGAHSINGTGADQLETDFARNIGQTSQQQVNGFLSAAPTWEQLADQFAYTPQEAAGDAMNLLQTRYNYALGAGALQKGIDENQYSAALNTARGAAMPDPAAVGSRNDALLQQAMQGISGGNSNYLTSIGGVVNGLKGILANYQSQQPNNAGFYPSAGAAIGAGGAGARAGYSPGVGGPSGGGGYYISGY